MLYIGDLSIQDVNVLCQLCSRAEIIIEFGVGASTQVFAQAASTYSRITSVETDSGWIERTRAVLDLLRTKALVEFVLYDVWKTQAVHPPLVDLVFDDGADYLRIDFAERAWKRLKVGGRLVFHDTRRSHDFAATSTFCQNHFLEISTIEVNTCASNLTVITKKLVEPYVNWNVIEQRKPVESGHAPLAETLAYLRKQRGESGF